ncbi:unnamed protein product, partial [Oppiella nova]
MANLYYDLNDYFYESNDFPIDDYKQVRNSRNFTGKVVLTTGSSSGIGEGIVKLFSILGASVVVTGRNATEITRVVEECQELSPNKLKPLEIVADLTKTDDVNRLLNETIKTFGKLDVLVNNAGVLKPSPLRDPNFMHVFDQTISINLRAYLELSQLAVPYLDKTNGTIISTSSIASSLPEPMGLAYEVSKSGVDMATRTMAMELGPTIRVNAINPGLIITNIQSGLDPVIVEALRKQMIDRTPLKRAGQPLDVAKGVVLDRSSLRVKYWPRLEHQLPPQQIVMVLVTGSSSGIGEGIVKLFSVLGANVVVTGRKEDQVKRVAQEVQELSPKKLKPLAVVADVTKTDDLNRLLNQTIQTFGKLDVLVNNAGIGMFAGVKDKNFMKVFDLINRVNLRAYLRLSQLSVPYLEETNGTIISISSIASMLPVSHCVDMMTKVLALELGPKIRVNAINPGLIETNINTGNTGVDPDLIPIFEAQMVSRTPLKMRGKPLDVAYAVVYLASKEAQFVSGANLVVDGGLVYNAGGITWPQVMPMLVTGSSSGIGEGIVKLFSVLGANVVVTGRKEDQVKRVAQEVQELSPKKLKPLAVVADVTKTDDLNRLLNQTIQTFGKLDVLVNNAGIGMFAGVKDKNFMKVFDLINRVNLRAYLRLSQLSVPYLEETNGTIISISSIASMLPTKLGMAYEISKSGVDMMTKVLALELGPKIRVNAVNPGLIETNINTGNTGVDPDLIPIFEAQMVSRTPLKMRGKPLDVAYAVVYLASKEAQFVSGANLVVDGGLAKNSRDFTGKVVLVTGSSSGIGEGIAKLFSVLGANVVVTGRKEDQVKHVLVNNAGMGVFVSVKDKNLMKVFDNVLRINLRAYVKLSQLAIPYLEETNGTIISISSIASTHPTKLALAYDISKAGVDMMTK